MAVREVIIPLKKHLVKFVQVDWDKIYELYEEYEGYEEFREKMILSTFETYIPYLIKEKFKLFDNYSLPLDENEIKIKISNQKKGLDENLNKFLTKDYVLVIISIKSNTFKKFTRKEMLDYNDLFADRFLTYASLSKSIEYLFLEYVVSSIHGNNPSKKLNVIYDILGLDEEDYKKGTLLRFYDRNKHEKSLTHQSKKFHKFDKELPDFVIFDILKQHLTSNISYSKLAKKYNRSKSWISTICNNKEAIHFYNEITRYHSSYFEYLSSPLRKKL